MMRKRDTAFRQPLSVKMIKGSPPPQGSHEGALKIICDTCAAHPGTVLWVLARDTRDPSPHKILCEPALP